MSTDELAARVQDLPAEFFNNIRDLVLNPSSDTVDIQKDKFPVELQVSRATRAQFAAQYYGNTAFRIVPRGSNSSYGAHDPLFKWLESLEQHHRLSITKIHFVRNEPYRDPLSGLLSLAVSVLIDVKFRLFWNNFTDFDKALHPATIISIEYPVECEDGQMELQAQSCTFWGKKMRS